MYTHPLTLFSGHLPLQRCKAVLKFIHICPCLRSLCITVYGALEHQLLYNMKAFLLPRRDMMAIAKPPPSLCWELKRFLWKMWQQNCTHCNHACSCHSLVHRHRRPHRHHHPWASKIFRSSFGFPKQWLVGGYRWVQIDSEVGLGWAGTNCTCSLKLLEIFCTRYLLVDCYWKHRIESVEQQ